MILKFRYDIHGYTQKIRDEKMSLDDDSYYDDLVTLSVGKMVVGKLDNDVILEKIRVFR